MANSEWFRHSGFAATSTSGNAPSYSLTSFPVFWDL